MLREGTGGKLCASMDNDSTTCGRFGWVARAWDDTASGELGGGGDVDRDVSSSHAGEEIGVFRGYAGGGDGCDGMSHSLRGGGGRG